MRSLWILCLIAGCAAPVVDVHGVPETPYDAPDSCWIGDVYVDVCRQVSEEEFEASSSTFPHICPLGDGYIDEGGSPILELPALDRQDPHLNERTLP